MDNYTKVMEITSADPIIETWLFMDSPYPVIGILALYLLFVLKLGPQWMQNRQPFNLKHILLVYNLYQVIFNVWLFVNIYKMENGYQAVTHCTIDVVDRAAAFSMTWWYFFSKVVDLCDTVFFVLRKKQSQVTFLHVYHHSILVAFTWFYIKFLPDGQGAFMAAINSFVHIVMYFYYLLSGLGPSFAKYLWWKKYITRLQLTQFVLVMVYLGYMIAMDCKMPTALIYFYVINDIVFIYLFSDFYRKAYKKKQESISDDKKLLSKMQ